MIWFVAILARFPHCRTTLQLSFPKGCSASRALFLIPSEPCGISTFLIFSFFPISTLTSRIIPLVPNYHDWFLFYFNLSAFENGPVLVALVEDFWNACVVCLLWSNLIARFSTSSGVNVSNVRVSWSTLFLIRDKNKSLAISASNTPNSAFAACAVNAAWKDSRVSFVSCDRVNYLYRS